MVFPPLRSAQRAGDFPATELRNCDWLLVDSKHADWPLVQAQRCVEEENVQKFGHLAVCVQFV